MQFSTKAFLTDTLGSPDGVITVIGRHWPNTPNRAAVEKWFYRDNVPGDWWPIVILALQAEGRMTFDFNTYVQRGEDDVFA